MSQRAHIIRIGGASGFWGDAASATAQLLAAGGLDYIVYDYLAEITMAILARARAKDAALGYATDFLSAAMAPNLDKIARQGVRVISNAGGMNPEGCAAALRAVIADKGLALKVAVVTGDDLMAHLNDIVTTAPHEMFSHAPLPACAKIASINAYLGAFPIAVALTRGADIVLTGRCVDSAVTLGACIHAFGWTADARDKLASGALAGHLLECGPQATGGNFTDWRRVADNIKNIGYPIAEISPDGAMTITKPANTGGLVSVGTVSEQMIYEIGDPEAYVLPDVTCDFSRVSLVQEGKDRVRVTGAKGRAAPPDYKTCLTWQDGWRGGHLFSFYGLEAEAKATAFAKAALERSSAALRRLNAPDFSETSVEIIGSEGQFGTARTQPHAREVAVKIAVRHPDPKGIALFLKEATGLGLAAAPGLSGFAGTRPRPSPVMALFSYLTPKEAVQVTISDDAGSIDWQAETSEKLLAIPPVKSPKPPEMSGPMASVPLLRLAVGRSGDKGDCANVGIIARDAAFLPYIWAALDETRIAGVYAHFLRGEVTRYYLPGCHAMNIVLSRVLGGGGTSSLRNDPQGKGYAQLLLAQIIPVPLSLKESLL